MKKVLKFHTKRGGRFHNSGHVIFVGFETIIQGTTLDFLFIDENDVYFEANGNKADIEINDDGTGYLDIDGDYDTIRCVFEDDLSVAQINALLRDKDSNVFINHDEIQLILKEYYSEYL